MRRRRTATERLLTGAILALSLQYVHAQTNTIFFDGEGDEAGITVPGACCFEFAGADFIGFEGVSAPGDPALTASGAFAYRVAGSDAGLIVTFEPPVDSVSFFFVHDPDNVGLIGSAWLFDEDGNTVDFFESRPATTHGDPANFIAVDPPTPIRTMGFVGLAAYLDNLSFTRGPSPSGAVGNDVVLGKADGLDITLGWTPSCLPSDTDYVVYEGPLGDFTSHVPAGNGSCTTGGATTATITPSGENRYYLVVPQGNSREGSYGTDSGGSRRPAGLTSCRPQLVGFCR